MKLPKKSWTMNHSKIFIALALCITDGMLNTSEKDALQDFGKEAMPDVEPLAYATLIQEVYHQLSKSKLGIDVLSGVQQSAQRIHKELDGDRKKLYRLLKQLRDLAHCDAQTCAVNQAEVRILNLVSRHFGFGKKIAVRLKQERIELIKL